MGLLCSLPAAGNVKPAPSLILESANSNENVYSNGEFISSLRGNVVFVYDDIRVKSDEATWWRKRGIITFRNNVQVVRGRQHLSCATMNFNKDRNTLIASGNFDFYDTTDHTRLTGQDGEYRIGAKQFHLTGRPQLVRYDTAAGDTLTITSVSMLYQDSFKLATANDNVRIRKGKLSTTCRKANFYTNTNFAELRGRPSVAFGIQRLSGDSINLDFVKGALHHAAIAGNSHGVYIDTAAQKRNDTAITHIWGDSLDMAVSDSGKPQVLWAIGKAVSKSFKKGDSAMANTARGKIMMLGFSGNGDIKNLKIWGNARSTYFVNDSGGGKGCNEVSGDSVSVSFNGGRVQFVKLIGSTRGVYFPLP